MAQSNEGRPSRFDDLYKLSTQRQTNEERPDVMRYLYILEGLSGNILYSWNEDFAKTSKRIRDLAAKIMENGKPLTADDLTIAFILRALNKNETKHLYQATLNGLLNLKSGNPLDFVLERLNLEWQLKRTQDLLESSRRPVAPRPSKRWRQCTNCQQAGHEYAYCIQPGGAMEGRTVSEALCIRRNRNIKNSRINYTAIHSRSSLSSRTRTTFGS